MNDVFLMLGSNLGNRLDILSKALHEINVTIGNILRKSLIYETQSWGYKDEKKYLNQLVIVSTKLSPDDVLHCAHNIEKKFGRVRYNYYTARSIDIDILFYDEIILKTDTLEIPHPRLHLRRFVLAPCNEIAPEFIHPVFQKSIHQLYNACNDKLFVTKIDYKQNGK